MNWVSGQHRRRPRLVRRGATISLAINHPADAVPGLLPNVVGFQEPNIGSVVPLGTTISLVVGQ
jgi:hypothetical protein